MVGLFIIAFQLYTYSVFAAEAIQDYAESQVPVMIDNNACRNMGEEGMIDLNNYNHYYNDYGSSSTLLQCEANYTNTRDAFLAFFMLAIFLAADMIQAMRVLVDAPLGLGKVFAFLAFAEVMGAFASACLAVSYELYIGEVTDAIEVGVGLLFIRELSQKTYAGVRNGKTRRYSTYFGVLVVLISVGMCMDPLCEHWLAPRHSRRRSRWWMLQQQQEHGRTHTIVSVVDSSLVSMFCPRNRHVRNRSI